MYRLGRGVYFVKIIAMVIAAALLAPLAAAQQPAADTPAANAAAADNDLGALIGRAMKSPPREAIPLYEKALVLAEKHYGAQHDNLQTFYFALGNAHQAVGEYRRAIEYFQRSLVIREKTLGVAHADIAYELGAMGISHQALGEYAQALPLHERALAIREKALGAEHLGVAVSLNNLGRTLEALGQFAKAAAVFERALAINEKAQGPVNANAAALTNNLASVYKALGQYARALSLFEQSVKIREQVYGREHIEVAVGYNNLASIHEPMGAYAKALPLHERALAMFEKLLGPDHPTVATSLNNQAQVLRELGQYPKAIELTHRALAIEEKALGGTHPSYAITLGNLANLYSANAEFARALDLHLRALAIREKALGATHPDVTMSLSNLASLYGAVADYAKAHELSTRVLAIREKTLGPEHPSVALTLNNRVWLYQSMGEFEKALPLALRSLAIYEKVHGSDHADVALAVNNLAALHEDMGDYAKALALHQRALSIREKVFGGDHPDVASTLNNLAVLYGVLNEFKKALSLAQRGLAINEKARGVSHPEVATNLNNIARLYDLMRDPGKALPLHQRALAIREARLGPEHPETTISRHNLGRLYESLRDYPRALAEYERALAVREKILGPEHPDIARSLNAIADASAALGRHDTVKPLRLRAQRIARLRNDPDSLWRAQNGLRAAYASDARDLREAREAQRGRVDLAIFYGKQAVNTIQGLRARIAGLDRGTRGAFLQDKSQVYRGLANLLIEQGRLAEAQQVLNLLKEEEFNDFIRLNEAPGGRVQGIEFTAFEQPWHERMQRHMEGLARVGAELSALERKAMLSITAGDKTRIAALARERAGANAQLDAFYRELEAAFAGTRPSIAAGADADVRAMQKTLAALGEGVVAIHYAVADHRLSLLLTTPAAQIARSVALDRRDLEQKLEFFRVALRNPAISAEPMARELHKLLIAPLAEDLKQAQARTLMLALDGSLRYIPFAALHDGSRYLIERYDVALYTDVARDNLQFRPGGAVTIAGLGVTRQIEDFEPLPAVKSELESIVRQGATGLIRGELKLDQQFSARTLREALAQKHPLVHIASHFVFRPGNESTSFLLLGDGDKLTLNRIREDKLDFSHVDLMTLSACETALGGGRNAQGEEIEGLGALVQKQGAKGVIATLWPVADESTGLLMRNFYQLREQKKLSKSAALRQAQLVLLKEGAVNRDNARGAAGPHAHPFYWAPFILMGNWL